MDIGSKKIIRILVADDDEAILEMYRSIFSPSPRNFDEELSRMECELFGMSRPPAEDEHHYRLTLCSQGDEAVEAVKRSVENDEPFSTAILDIRMPPGPNGVWTAEQIRKLDPNVNILMVTGFADFDPEEISRLVPPMDKIFYMQKPLRPAETRAFATSVCAKWISESQQRSRHSHLEEMVEDRNVKLLETNRRLEKEIQGRREQQEALEKSERYLKTLLNTIRCGLLVVDAHTLQIKDANPFAMEMLGADRERDVIGCPSPLFLSIDPDRDYTKGRGFDLRYGKLRTIRGETLDILESVAPLETKGESLLILSFVDVTESKRAEEERMRLLEQLRQAQKMEAIGMLAGGTAHDFNNILQAILGYADLVLDRIGDDSESRYCMDQIRSAGQRAAELVKQIMTFSRHNNSEYRDIALQQVIKETHLLLRATLPSTVEIVLDIDSDCGAVTADWTEMQQVVLNLCTNAYQAMPEGCGTLTMSLGEMMVDEEMARQSLDLRCIRYARLSVKDTGVGMNADTVKRVFDPYFTTKGLGRGTGLGLSTVYGIIQRMKGAITVQSEPGRGSVFNIFIPVSDKKCETKAEKKPEESAPGHNERVLFVDDEELLVEVGIRRLTQLGYQVKGFSNSRDALNYFRSNPYGFDLVITDQTMPELTGALLAGEILHIRPEIPVILCTGYSETVDETAAMSLGIFAYLFKPVSSADLSLAMCKALQKAQPVT